MCAMIRVSLLFTALAGLISNTFAQDAAPWTTSRGNAQRTASDGIAGPAAPKVLWTLKSKDHFIASPVPHGDRLYVSGLGPFNVGNFACLSIDPGAKSRMLWSKTTPYLKLPTVS